MRVIEKNYIGGAWQKISGQAFLTLYDPATDVPYATVRASTDRDVRAAMAAAKQAKARWAESAVSVRRDMLQSLKAAIATRAEDFVASVRQEIGTPVRFAKEAHIGAALSCVSSYIDALDALDAETLGNARVRHAPAGIVAALTPWNFPLFQMVAKLAAALAAGCCVVLKPSEFAPCSAVILAEILDQIELPPGVVNVIFGDGATGAWLVDNPNTDLISFTGSTEVGRRIATVAAAHLRPTILELGGKSANIFLPDADLIHAVPAALRQCFANSGQFCASLSRLLVPEDMLAKVEALAVKAVALWQPGDPSDPSVVMGPVASRQRQSEIRKDIQLAVAEGARLISGGADQPEGLPRGAYVRPTLLSDVTSDMQIARKEIFGPVLAIMPYRDEADALRIANDSVYGLSGGVWSRNKAKAAEFAGKIRTGQVVLNGAALDLAAPFGGVSHSGWGREYGRYGIRAYTSTQAILGYC